MKKTLFFIMSLILVIMYSCTKDETTYKISGVVTNTTENFVRNATVALYKEGSQTSAYSTSTNDEGRYTLSGIKEGNYFINVSKDGYDDASEMIEVSSNISARNIQILGTTNINGTIINSQTGYGLANARVAFTRGTAKSIQVDTTEANAELIVITDAYGYFSILGGPSGTFYCVIRADGFTTRVIVEPFTFSAGYTYEFPNQTLVETLGEGKLRIVLSWGESPSDLDSHLTGPLAGSSDRFHCYFSDKNPYNSGVNLDVDDTYSYGPETTTILEPRDGVYRFSVYNYSNSYSDGWSGIYNSPTVVEIYDYTGLAATYVAPSGSYGNTWRVCEITISGNNYTITPLNTYEYFSGSGDVTKGVVKSGNFPVENF